MVCDDGIVLYQGKSHKMVAVRVIEEKEEKYQNIYYFYSNTTVVPLQAFQMIVNMIGNLNACGANIITKNVMPMELNCLVSSIKQHENTPESSFEQIEEGIYYMKYENKIEKSPNSIAKYLIGQKGINCSMKEVTEEEREEMEKKAFIKHCEIVNETKKETVENVEKIEVEKLKKIAIEPEL